MFTEAVNQGLPVEEIAEMEGISVEEVEKIIEIALQKVRAACGKILRTI